MSYIHVDQVPARRQWEANSAPNQAANCGPTAVSFQADFYRDATFGIEATRDLVPNEDDQGTNQTQQATMLNRRGVPAAVGQPSGAELTALVASGRRPVTIGMLMSSVPATIRGHPFTGIHAVVARQNAVVNGVPGKLIMDPNFGYGHTVDPTNGARFYPDTVVEAARIGAGRHAIIPSAPKEVDVTITITKYPNPRTWRTKGGVLTGRRLDPPPLAKTGTFAAGSPAHSGAEYEISPTPAGWAPGPYQLVVDGYFFGYLVPNSQIDLDPVTAPPAGGIPPAEHEAAVKKAAHDAAADVAAQAGVPIVTAYAAEKYP